MARFSALLDACVLVPVALADTLLRLAEVDLYRPLWSQRILDEVIAAIEEIHPDLAADGRARRRVSTMDAAFEDASVTGWENLVEGIDLPDRDDRHVVAAAQRGRADLIVTANLSDFPPERLAALAIEVQHPDDFLLDLLDLDPDRTVRVLFEQAQAAQNPTITETALLGQLARCGVPRFADSAARQLWRGM
nr:PIN domain-containing protein [Propionibacterium sp.]